MANYDILGNIAIIKFNEEISQEEKLKQAEELLKIPSVKTVLEKIDKVKGRLRTIQTRYLVGEKNKIALYKENGCLFKLNIESCYFSPRLANDRKEVALSIKKNERVLVMFSGVSPYPIVISKYSKAKEIIAVELGRECCKYASENVRLNKIKNVQIIQGDVKKVIPKLFGKLNKKEMAKFDVVVMARPNLKDSFLKYGLMVAKKNARIIYHGFWKESEKDKEIIKLVKEAKKLKRKISIVKVKEIGDIAPYEHRYRVEFKVLD